MELDRIPPIAKYLSAVFMLSRLGRNTVWFFLPIFFKQHIDSVFLIGLMTSVSPIITILLDIPVGNLVQRAGEKIVIFLGLIANLMPGLLYITAIPALLVTGKVFEGIVKVMMWNGGWTLSLKSSDEENESESQSIFLLGVNLAAIIGPMIGGYLIMTRGFRLPFALWVFSAWLSALVFYLYIGLEGEKGFVESLEELFHRTTYADDYHHLKANWPSLWFPMLLIFLYSIIFSFYWLAVPLLLDNVGASYPVMGVIFGLAMLPTIFQFLFGEWADRIGRLKLSAILGLLATPILIAMGSLTDIYIVGGLFFLAKMLTSGLSPVLHAYYDSCVPDEVEGELTGFLEFAKHVGQSIGPLMAGTVASIWTINTSFYFAGGIALALFGLSFYGMRNSKE
ncbi:MAG: MFS transporter [Candidatus Nanohaloarchaea archaeon]